MPVSDFTPTLEEVGARIRRRTVNHYGAETGTFLDPDPSDDKVQTTPTASQAQPLIDDAVDRVATAVGVDLPDGPDPDDPDSLRRAAKRLVALRAAMGIELEFYGEQVGSAQGSTYPQLKTLWDDDRKALIEAVNEASGGTGTGGESVGSEVTDAAYAFPPAAGFDSRRF